MLLLSKNNFTAETFNKILGDVYSTLLDRVDRANQFKSIENLDFRARAFTQFIIFNKVIAAPKITLLAHLLNDEEFSLKIITETFESTRIQNIEIKNINKLDSVFTNAIFLTHGDFFSKAWFEYKLKLMQCDFNTRESTKNHSVTHVMEDSFISDGYSAYNISVSTDIRNTIKNIDSLSRFANPKAL